MKEMFFSHLRGVILDLVRDLSVPAARLHQLGGYLVPVLIDAVDHYRHLHRRRIHHLSGRRDGVTSAGFTRA